jgi:hypothetical protein
MSSPKNPYRISKVPFPKLLKAARDPYKVVALDPHDRCADVDRAQPPGQHLRKCRSPNAK